jgi:hypothetical protein
VINFVKVVFPAPDGPTRTTGFFTELALIIDEVIILRGAYFSTIMR